MLTFFIIMSISHFSIALLTARRFPTKQTLNLPGIFSLRLSSYSSGRDRAPRKQHGEPNRSDTSQYVIPRTPPPNSSVKRDNSNSDSRVDRTSKFRRDEYPKNGKFREDSFSGRSQRRDGEFDSARGGKFNDRDRERSERRFDDGMNRREYGRSSTFERSDGKYKRNEDNTRYSTKPKYEQDSYNKVERFKQNEFDEDRGSRGSYSRSSESRRYPSRKYDEEEKTEPHYGYYDGDHLYGISSVLLALKANRRKISQLLVQADMGVKNKKDSEAAKEITTIASEKGIEIMELSKHDLNMISDNKPHQGFILRATPLEYEPIDTLDAETKPQVVLMLDEVVDPHNLGALLRTSYFLGCDKVIVCAKNSAPLSPTVSKVSAGAMEIMTINSVKSPLGFLQRCRENGWQVVGTDLSEKAIDLQSLPVDQPTILVLGNEGHGIRTSILNLCSHRVKIPSNANSNLFGKLSMNVADSVDSLNVSVTGGIILHNIIDRIQRNTL